MLYSTKTESRKRSNIVVGKSDSEAKQSKQTKKSSVLSSADLCYNKDVRLVIMRIQDSWLIIQDDPALQGDVSTSICLSVHSYISCSE